MDYLIGLGTVTIFLGCLTPNHINSNEINLYIMFNKIEILMAKFDKIYFVLQLDDWVLCRIYNKKGTLEKYQPLDQKMGKFAEIEEEQKPKIMVSGQNTTVTQTMISNDQLHMDTSDSVPVLHTDTSCSEQVVSPEVAWEKEVQSEPKWNDNDIDNVFDYFQYNYMDGFAEDPFAPQVQYQMDQLSPLQDMFMYLQKPL